MVGGGGSVTLQPSRLLRASPWGLSGPGLGLITMHGKGSGAYWHRPGVLSAMALTKAMPERGLPHGSFTFTMGPGNVGSVRGFVPSPKLSAGVADTRAAVSSGKGSQPFQGNGTIDD